MIDLKRGLMPSIVMDPQSLANEARILKRADVCSQVYDVVEQTLNNMIRTPTKEAICHTVNSTLQAFTQGQQLIRSFEVTDVECGPQKPLREVHDLPVDAKPGDEYHARGKKYGGLVVSSQGNGDGIVFAEPADIHENEVRVTVEITLFSFGESIEVEVAKVFP